MEKTMTLEKATWNNEAELTQFFEKFEFEDLIKFQIKRPRGFFGPYQTQGHEFDTFCLRAKDGQLLAEATFLYPEYQLNARQKKLKLAIATDLRVLPNRQATIGWHQNFIPVLETIRRDRQVDGFLSLLSRSDRKVLNTFLRSHPYRREVPRYYLYQNFKLTSLHGFLPFSSVHLPGVEVRPATEEDWGSIDTFLNRSDWNFLSPVKNAQDLKMTLHNMGLNLSYVWLALSKSRKSILGLVLAVPAQMLQEYIPISYQLRAHNFRQFLKFGRLWGWSHSLTKPKTRTGLELPLQFRHIGLIRTRHPDVFQLILQTIWKELQKDEFLVYMRDARDLTLNLRPGALTANIHHDLFAITLPNESSHQFSKIWNNEPFRLDSFNHF